ncbi:hypothetical protein ABWH74_001928 [Burkholderia vietnamiensis]
MFIATTKEFTEAFLQSRPVMRIDNRSDYEKLVDTVNDGLSEAMDRMWRGEYVRVVRIMQEPTQPRSLFKRLDADLRAAGFSVIYYEARAVPSTVSGRGIHGDFIEQAIDCLQARNRCLLASDLVPDAPLERRQVHVPDAKDRVFRSNRKIGGSGTVDL